MALLTVEAIAVTVTVELVSNGLLRRPTLHGSPLLSVFLLPARQNERVNYRLFELINASAGRIDGIDDVMEFAATWLVYLIFAASAVPVAVSLHRRRTRPVLELGVALVLAFAAATALAHLNSQLRPFQSHHVHQLIPHDPGVSLPSDHATAAFTLAFGVYAFLNHRWGVILGTAALTVGAARVWVGVHYPGDILAAAAIAGLAVMAVTVGSHRQRGRTRSPSAAR
ncbi:phosphatase PAP2 family protein [Micromonospora sp. AMSO31t]|uniref:phosphatase PAP2 family protein n=1 Tax=Micromonospora sp. AMSO31t TaxID=2650566 RepID=UPI00124B37A6|nr:phosphatase PAP2 family protein [Micromonospora sp. AMSO31t]KAB1916283.1 phosphatase PAP2 family protein [Micromonospora sp. AMSO31t]